MKTRVLLEKLLDFTWDIWVGRDKYLRKWQTSSRVYSPRILVSASILRFGWQVLVILHFHYGHRTAIKSQISE